MNHHRNFDIRDFLLATRYAFLLLVSAVGLPSASAADHPNIILILADDLGYGDLGVYGCQDIETPNLDQLAESGVRLTDGYVSHPYCGPSRAGLMTGRYQQRFGFRFNPSHQKANASVGLDVEEETLGDLFSRAGYHTGAIGKWHLGSADCFHPNNRGFDFFFGFLSGGHNYFPVDYDQNMRRWVGSASPPVPEIYGYGEPLEVNGIALPPTDGYLTDILTTQAIGFIRQKNASPFFLYVAYNAPHVPLQAPQETIARYAGIPDEKRRVYAAMVDNLDRNVGRILDELASLGVRDNTLVVFLSDNGGHTGCGATNGPLSGQKGMTEEGGIRVPFICSWPDGLPRGQINRTPISALDLLPTFAELAGVTPQGKPLDGVNVLAWLRGEADGHPHPQLCWLSHDSKQGIRVGDLKGVRSKATPWKLYDLAEDVGETQDRASAMPAKKSELADAYEQWLSAMPAARWLDPGKKAPSDSLPSGKEIVERYR